MHGRLRRPSNEPPREGQSAAVLLARFKQRYVQGR